MRHGTPKSWSKYERANTTAAQPNLSHFARSFNNIPMVTADFLSAKIAMDEKNSAIIVSYFKCVKQLAPCITIIFQPPKTPTIKAKALTNALK